VLGRYRATYGQRSGSLPSFLAGTDSGRRRRCRGGVAGRTRRYVSIYLRNPMRPRQSALSGRCGCAGT